MDQSYNQAPTPGVGNLSGIADDTSSRVPTDTKISLLKAQTKKKHTMPRFFKFEEPPSGNQDGDDDEDGNQNEPTTEPQP